MPSKELWASVCRDAAPRIKTLAATVQRSSPGHSSQHRKVVRGNEMDQGKPLALMGLSTKVPWGLAIGREPAHS